jgi:hypothetical protein
MHYKVLLHMILEIILVVFSVNRRIFAFISVVRFGKYCLLQTIIFITLFLMQLNT